MEKPLFPMRINKYLAYKQYSTRKGGDELVEKRRVFINGRLAVLGDKVLETDKVDVVYKGAPKAYEYYAFNKPTGLETPQIKAGGYGKGKQDRVFPVGRLDKDSHGLIILTNDGRITDKLLNPEYVHEKEYEVRTKDKLRPNFKERMENGVDIEGYVTKKCHVDILDTHVFSITLTEGKKHQIRRMVAALFNEVRDLKRTRIMNIYLGGIPSGKHRPIEGEELALFLQNLGFN